MTTFAETPEGQKYLLELQEAGNMVPDHMTGLEAQTFKMFQERRQKAGVIIKERDRLTKVIAAAQEQEKALTRQGDLATGEATAFAEILLAAEDGRRNSEAKAPSGGETGDPENEDQASSNPQGNITMAPLPNVEGVAKVVPIPNTFADAASVPLTTAAPLPEKAEEAQA